MKDEESQERPSRLSMLACRWLALGVLVFLHPLPFLLHSSPGIQSGTCVLALVAGRTDSPADGPPDGPPFVLETVSGESVRGPLNQLLEGWTVRLGGPQRTRRDRDAWLTLRSADQPLPANPASAHLILTNRDRIPVTPSALRLANERLTCKHPALAGGGETRLPISTVSVLWLTTPDEEDGERFRRRLIDGRRRNDLVVLRNGDLLQGTLTGIDGKQLQVEVSKRAVAVDLAKVAAVGLSSDLATPLRPRGTFGRLVLTDGSRLTVTSAECADGKTLTATTAFNAKLTVPLERLAALDLMQARAVYLSDLEPEEYRHTAYLGLEWPLVVDGSVAGRDLRLAGSVHDRGLGMHSASRVTYALPERARRFEARVGLDDRTGRRGSVRVRVLVDGKERPLGSGKGGEDDLTHDRGPIAVRIDVTGARKLTLVVEFGARADIGDHVNWVDARLVR